MLKQINAASAFVTEDEYKAAVNSMIKSIESRGVEIIHEPEFGRQGNFLLCKVIVKKKRSKKPIVGYGISKRNNNDPRNSYIGQYNALQRALFGQLSQHGRQIAPLSIAAQMEEKQ